MIFFHAEISVESYQRLFELLIHNTGTVPHTIVLRSEGGDTAYGRKIGEMIFERGLDVEVETICFSSCANYLFPAGKHKRIQAGAIVGWHGNEHQGLLLKEEEQTLAYNRQKLAQAFLQAGMDPKEHQELFEQEFQRLQQGPAEERQFYAKTGIDPALALLGIGQYDGKKYVGWTYSPEDMQKFGLKHVVYQGEVESYPSATSPYATSIFVIEYNQNRRQAINALIRDQGEVIEE